MGLAMATKAFFKLLGNRELCDSFQQLLDCKALPAPVEKPKPAPPPPKKPTRSDAVSLLAALQREARFIDIVKEPLSQYSDEQIGAAARDVLRDTGAILDRMFAIAPLTDAEDGSEIETPAQFDAAKYHLTGNVAGDGPFRGQLAHHGWTTTKCEVPKWSGDKSSASIIAPIEVEIR